MITVLNKERCSGCGACVNICPRNCMRMELDEEGFCYPIIDESKCIQCGLCERVCIMNAEQEECGQPIKTYVARNKLEFVRETSSSGGVFSAVARHVLKNGGAVFGAVLQEDLSVKHEVIWSEQEIDKLRGAKYLQSDVGTSYRQTKTILDKGKQVMFSGTPCQIYGLRAFLRKEYSNLITISVVCHGVPSSEVFGTYISHGIKKKTDEKVESISFRDKTTGWKNYSVLFQTNKRHIRMLHDDCLFMRGYLAELYSRPSCHQCNWKKHFEKSDIILGDAWGIQFFLPDVDDDKGISYVIVGTEKGEQLLKDLGEDLLLWDVEYHDCLKYNPSIYWSNKIHPNRKEFFEEIKDKPNQVNMCIKKYTRMSFVMNVKIRLSRLIRKLGINL